MKYLIIPGLALLLAGGLWLWLSGTRKVEAPSVIPSPAAQEEPVAEKEPTRFPDTIPELAEKQYEGSDFRILRTLDETDAYTRSAISYESEGFTVSGVALQPKGPVPPGGFPVIVLNHGYVDPDTYQTGDGLLREQDFFARAGYVVLYSDYRNHADSDTDPQTELRPRSGYVEDVLNLISAVRGAGLPGADFDRLGMLGFSLGGGVTLNIMTAKPETAGAYVLLAPINADYRVNFDKWVKTEWPDTAAAFYEAYGTPEENPQFWHDVSAQNFLDRVNAPVMLHQGLSDGEVPPEWSRDLAARLERVGKDIAYFEYPRQPHIFRDDAEGVALQRSLEFFDRHVKNAGAARPYGTRRRVIASPKRRRESAESASVISVTQYSRVRPRVRSVSISGCRTR